MADMPQFKIKKSAGVGAWDATRGGGAQHEGVALGDVTEFEYLAKKRVVQARIKLVLASPAERVGEEVTTHVNIAPLVNEKKTISACEESVGLLSVVAGWQPEDKVKEAEIEGTPEEFRKAFLSVKGIPVHTYPATDDLYDQVEIIMPSKYQGISDGTDKPPADRRSKRKSDVGGMVAAQSANNPFAGGGGATPASGGGGGGGGGGNPFASS